MPNSCIGTAGARLRNETLGLDGVSKGRELKGGFLTYGVSLVL